MSLDNLKGMEMKKIGGDIVTPYANSRGRKGYDFSNVSKILSEIEGKYPGKRVIIDCAPETDNVLNERVYNINVYEVSTPSTADIIDRMASGEGAPEIGGNQNA